MKTIVFALMVLMAVASGRSEEVDRFLELKGSPYEAFWEERLSAKTSISVENAQPMEVLRFLFSKAKISVSIEVGEAKAVTCRMTNVPLRDILREVARQSGWRFRFEEEGSRMVVEGK